MSRFFRHKFLVVGGREQTVEFAGILQRDLDHPRAVGIFINFFWRRGQFAVDFSYGAGNGGEQVRHSLHRFDRTECLASGQLRSNFWRLDEDNVSQRLLRVVGNANRG